MGFPTGVANGYIRTHADGRRWQFSSTKGVWKIKTNVVDDADYTGATGPQGPQGPIGLTNSSATSLNGYTLSVVASVPASPVANTIYLVEA